MNDSILYKIDFYSDWHCGTGLNSGAAADALVIKREYAPGVNLPYIPGRTIKGLFKEAALDLAELGKVNSEFIEKCFEYNSNIDSLNKGGFFTDAQLAGNIIVFLQQQPTFCNKLYRYLSFTKIDPETGTAEKNTLRQIEVAIPLTLYGKIIGVNSSWQFYEDLIKCMKYTKRLGVGRNRGLGRCHISIVEEGGQND